MMRLDDDGRKLFLGLITSVCRRDNINRMESGVSISSVHRCFGSKN